MPSPLPATSPNSRPTLLVAAISARALAAAARRAGCRVLAADLFCDADTRALAARTARIPGDLRSGIDPAAAVPALEALADGEPVAAVILGSGFERQPDLVDAIAVRLPLAGNRGAAIRRVKDPQALAADCRALGIPHPAFSLTPPADPRGWLCKAVGGAGGVHVAEAADDAAAGPGRYFQRRVDGRSLSALFLADGQGAQLVGLSRQWTAPAEAVRYRYGGAVRLRRFDPRRTAAIAGWLSALAGRAGLVGLGSADFIDGPDGLQLVEINPRPGATLDIFDSEEAPLLAAHLAAAAGRPVSLPRFADSMASMVAYAERPIEAFPAVDWPDWTADRQPPGSRLAGGDPVCTVFASAGSAAAARRALGRRAAALSTAWQGEAR